MRRSVCGITIRLLITLNHRPPPLPLPRAPIRPPQRATQREDNYCSIAVIHCASTSGPRDALKSPENWVKKWRKCVTSGDEDGPPCRRASHPGEEGRRLVMVLCLRHIPPVSPSVWLTIYAFRCCLLYFSSSNLFPCYPCVQYRVVSPSMSLRIYTSRCFFFPS